MKKLLALVFALGILTVFAGVGLTQQRDGSQVKPFPKAPAGPLSKAPAAPVIFESAPAPVNWPSSLGAKQGDLVESLRGQKLTGEVVGSGPQAIIVIWGSDGKCKVCIGKAVSCALVCGFSRLNTQSQSH